MNYFLVNKISIIDEKVAHITVGYLTSQEDADSFNDIWYDPYSIWISDNKNALELGTTLISEYLETNVVYGIEVQTTNIDGLDIHEITNLNYPEGV